VIEFRIGIERIYTFLYQVDTFMKCYYDFSILQCSGMLVLLNLVEEAFCGVHC